ncbi:hypothetical protein, partial [Pseudomonas pseudonitroreducens]|uniref:hypothetical protein n=1 Tax=Pseudomonas pseudonitroreducens TaxID=2892326 RepID=UPI001F2F2236
MSAPFKLHSQFLLIRWSEWLVHLLRKHLREWPAMLSHVLQKLKAKNCLGRTCQEVWGELQVLKHREEHDVLSQKHRK